MNAVRIHPRTAYLRDEYWRLHHHTRILQEGLSLPQQPEFQKSCRLVAICRLNRKMKDLYRRIVTLTT